MDFMKKYRALLRENRDLKDENEMLKKAAVIFSRGC